MEGDETLAPSSRRAMGDETFVPMIVPGAVTPQIHRSSALCERADAIKAARDIRFPLKPFTKPSCRWRRETKRAAKLTTKAARIRKHGLHQWSTVIVSQACDLTVVKPPVKEATASPRGDEKQWGAHVKTVSALNRNTLNQAPAMAVQMLSYKAEEAGIRPLDNDGQWCGLVVDEAPAIAIGAMLVESGRKLRRMSRNIKKEAVNG
jgi:hypothetical protein